MSTSHVENAMMTIILSEIDIETCDRNGMVGFGWLVGWLVGLDEIETDL